MISLSVSYQSEQFIDAVNPENYVFGKMNGSIVADVDGNGFVDIVRFPSTHSLATPFDPIIWLNEGGIFTPTQPSNPSNIQYQYIRNTAEGDFDGDGKLDFILADQGWELEGRNPDYFFGGYPILLKGIESGLEIVPLESWIEGAMPDKSFYHISAVGDYDNDGDTDLAIAAFGNFNVFENNGNGTFSWSELNIPDYSSGGTAYGSGTGFVKLGEEYALVVGSYRMFSPEDYKFPPVVLKYIDGEFVKTGELSKPNLRGREQNYGAVDMYNIDINNDGKQDLIMLWETEASGGGIDDGLSVITDEVYFNGTRYTDISDSILTVWIQDESGNLQEADGVTHYNLTPETTSGAELKFTDFNNDGYMDFYVLNFGLNINNWNEVIWINDGEGGFSNPSETLFQVNADENLPEWYNPTPYFFDANNDGVMDVITARGVFEPESYNYRNIGEEIRVFLGNADAPSISFAYGRYEDAKLFKGDNGAYDVLTDIGVQHYGGTKRLQFTDRTIALDLDGHAGQTAKILGAVFGKDAVYNKEYAGIGLHYLDSGMSYEALMDLALNAALGVNANDHASVVNLLYKNVLNVEATESDAEPFIRLLDDGMTKGALGVMAAETTFNAENIDLVGLQETGLAYELFEGPQITII